MAVSYTHLDVYKRQVEYFLTQQRMCLTMSQISGRRTNQLRDLMAVLKFRAVDLDYRARIANQRLRGCFHDTRLARSRWPQKQEVPNGTSRGRHPSQVHLINIHDLLDGLVQMCIRDRVRACDPPQRHAVSSRLFLETSLRQIC